MKPNRLPEPIRLEIAKVRKELQAKIAHLERQLLEANKPKGKPRRTYCKPLPDFSLRRE